MGMACSRSVLVWLLKRLCRKISQIVPSFFSYTLISTFKARLYVLTCLGSKVHPSKDVPTGLSPARLGRRGWTRWGGGWSGQEKVGSGRRPACVISKRKASGVSHGRSLNTSVTRVIFSQFTSECFSFVDQCKYCSFNRRIGNPVCFKGTKFLVLCITLWLIPA